MEKNKNNFFAKLYCWFYDINTDDLPNNTCSYYFNLWVAILLFIPQQIWLIPYYLKHGITSNKTQDRGLYSAIILAILTVIVCLLGYFITIGLFASALIFIFLYLLYLHTFTDFPKRFKPYVFLKRKFCSKINWK